ncbi:MAG TPA: hypothetical protein PKA27_07080 [Fimbriimonadaceae bacterium]|nr:hypothetical protein [Fimbriimonadaceae bacterium]
MLNIAASVIEHLTPEGAAKYGSVQRSLEDRIGEDARLQLPYALALLFALGVVDYTAHADIVYLRIQEREQ